VGDGPKRAGHGVVDPGDQDSVGDILGFDTEKRIGVFTGHVRVFDPRFNIQSDKLTVFIHKEEGEGLEKAIAEGQVGVVRDKPDPKGGPPSKAVGLSEKAVYTSSDGNVVLTGSPRVQQGLDTHVATSPETVMVLSQDGHLTTHGPSRTEIRQALGVLDAVFLGEPGVLEARQAIILRMRAGRPA